jgi:uncharacterized protein YxjI
MDGVSDNDTLISIFKDNWVNGSMFLKLTNEELKDDLGIVSASIREKLMRLVDQVNMTTTNQQKKEIAISQRLRKDKDSIKTTNNKGPDILQANFMDKDLHQFKEIAAISSKIRYKIVDEENWGSLMETTFQSAIKAKEDIKKEDVT